MKVNIAICDDEIVFLNDQYELIKTTFEDEGIPCVIDTFNNSSDLINSDLDYDIIFLDVEMDGMNGIEAAEKLHKDNKDCLIFFVTNYENYMDKALDKHAFRFWVKPINKNRLIDSIDSAMKRINAQNKYLMTFKENKKPVKFLLENVICAYIEDKKIHIKTTDSEIIAKDVFMNIKKQLNTNYFFECHHSYMVNFNFIKDYTSKDIICRNGEKNYLLYISKRKYSDFKKSFMKWMSETR